MSIYGYVRVSTERQAVAGSGLSAQHDYIKKEGDKRGGDWAETWHGPAQFPGFYVDDGVSAYSIDLFDRPAGAALRSVLKRGDTIIFKDYSRGWRSTADFSRFVKIADSEGWNVVVLGPVRIDLGNANGRMMARFFVSLAEWESDIKGQRIKDALAVKRANGEDMSRQRKPKRSTSGEYVAPPRALSAETEPEVEITGKIYPYARCSGVGSTESGLGLQYQWEAGCAYCDEFTESHPNVIFGGIFVDPSVSALKHPLRERPQGRELDKVLQSGDHVVFLRPDRAFGTMIDALKTCEDWSQRGITVHFSEFDLDMGTPIGKGILGVMSFFSEMERQMAKIRSAESNAARQALGKWTGKQFNPFWRLRRWSTPSSRSIDDVYLPDPYQIATFRLLLKMTEVYGWTKVKACERVEELLAKRENRPAIPISGVVRRSKLSAKLRKKIPTNQSGKIFPLWTPDRYRWAREVYDFTISHWRSLTPFQRARAWKAASRECVYRRQKTRRREAGGPRKRTEKEIRQMAERKSQQMRDQINKERKTK